MKNLILLVALSFLPLTACTVRQTVIGPGYETTTVADTTMIDVNTPPYAGYRYTGSWHAGTPNYYDTTINVLAD